MASSGRLTYAHATCSDSRQWLAGAGDIPTRFVNELANAEELQSLTPPFRLLRDQDLTGCQPAGSTVTQDLDYYATHSATACAQACIEWNAELNTPGRNGALCNAAVYKDNLHLFDPRHLINSTGSSTTYTEWNCWIKVIGDICGPRPPPDSYFAPGADLLIMQANNNLGIPCVRPSRCACFAADRA